MQKQQVFKVKGMQRDASMANANGEFAYEILNMRLMPAEDLSGFSLTNEKGTLATGIHLNGQILGQCATNDSLIVFTKDTDFDYIYKLYTKPNNNWDAEILYKGHLNFSTEYPIEALFNYETEDIQKVYWVDGINQLRCINLKGQFLREESDNQFDSVKELKSIPEVEISKSVGGAFAAGVLQYYITYFNEFSTESPIVYTSPLLYIANDNRGADVNTSVNTAYTIKISDLDIENWKYIRIYTTHRTSLDSIPEGSIIQELKIPDNGIITFTDFGNNRTSINPSDLYFKGSKFVKAGTMTVKDQVMFLGNLDIHNDNSLDFVAIKTLFDSLRDGDRNIDDIFFTDTTKEKPNLLQEYENTSYYFKSNLNNVEPITHYKYGEKYRFGITLMDKYGNWSNPIWIKDDIIKVAPLQKDENTLELACPKLNLAAEIIFEGQTFSLSGFLQQKGAIQIKPVVVFPDLLERKVVAQGVVCPTVYNLKDRKENRPYAQASWFMRPNVPGDIWGIEPFSNYNDKDNKTYTIGLKPDLFNPSSTVGMMGTVDLSDIYDPESFQRSISDVENFRRTRGGLIYDDVLISDLGDHYNGYNATHEVKNVVNLTGKNLSVSEATYEQTEDIRKYIIDKGSWVEFRHNYALRSKGWTFGDKINTQKWSLGKDKTPIEFNHTDRQEGFPELGLYTTIHIEEKGANAYFTAHKLNFGSARVAELDVSRFGTSPMFNRFSHSDNQFIQSVIKSDNGINVNKVDADLCNTGSSAYYVDASIITLNSPEVELTNNLVNLPTADLKFRIIGMIPITANASDSSLIVDNSAYNPSNRTDVGYKKFSAQTLNIGHTAFRGTVAHNLFYGNDFGELQYMFSADNQESRYLSLDEQRYKEASYSYSALHPWQATGYITGFPNMFASGVVYSKLKRKILSNIRYSASTYFFNKDEVNIKTDNKYADASSNIIGWKPMTGNSVALYNSSDTSIIKIPQSTYKQPLVYQGNIDTLAISKSGSSPLPVYTSLFGRKLIPGDNLVDSEPSSTEGSLFSETVYKTGVAAQIKYKSSPHFVVSFNNINWGVGKNVKMQEILPALGGTSSDSSAITTYNWEGIDDKFTFTDDLLKDIAENTGCLYEDQDISSIPHQSVIRIGASNIGLPGYNAQPENNIGQYPMNYGWLWLGEIYREQDPTFGGDTEYSLQNNAWENAGIPYKLHYPQVIKFKSLESWAGPVNINREEFNNNIPDFSISENNYVTISNFALYKGSNTIKTGNLQFVLNVFLEEVVMPFAIPINSLVDFPLITQDNYESTNIVIDNIAYSFGASSRADGKLIIDMRNLVISGDFPSIGTFNVPVVITWNTDDESQLLSWDQGDTYYQRFDTLKTYAYSEEDENSIIDITSFMVETRLNIDGRYDRNRGQESNLQMSPTNFNLVNDVYSQRDNFFTYRILDDDVQSRTTFPNQITWSLTKTAGEQIDAWMNVTLASILDLDGTKGKISALKNFNNNIIAFQEKGLSHIMFNSRAQIATSEAVPIQIANTGKVDGQQYLTTNVGCQDKWNIVTTPNGLYFVDYFNKSIYRFNGQLEDISTPNGFRSWCYENLNSTANILGYYDVKNKEVMYYIGDTGFTLDNSIHPGWLGFSELTGAFSSFYTYPKARLANVQDKGLWLLSAGDDTNVYTYVYTHQTGNYNELLNTDKSFYGLTVIPRQDSNIVKTFNNVEFRADSYNGIILDDNNTFDTISAETEYQERTPDLLTYDKYRPSNLKKKFRTWRANIPRVNNGYNRFVNQWAKIGLWKMKPNTEKTILHDLSVWYSE